jgi:ABC-type multidrug transport system ATPase subunit
MELVASPCVLMLDEPTSGLDSTASAKVVEALYDLTRVEGMTVIAVIHQPSAYIFEQFDQLLLLQKGGGLVYSGPPLLAGGYFAGLGFLPDGGGGKNVADFLLDVVGGARQPDDLHAVVQQYLQWREREHLQQGGGNSGCGGTSGCGGDDDGGGGGQRALVDQRLHKVRGRDLSKDPPTDCTAAHH